MQSKGMEEGVKPSGEAVSAQASKRAPRRVHDAGGALAGRADAASRQLAGDEVPAQAEQALGLGEGAPAERSVLAVREPVEVEPAFPDEGAPEELVPGSRVGEGEDVLGA